MANNLTAYTPELWSRKSVALLREKIVVPQLVRRDFSEDLAQMGDTVNTRKPAKMTAGDVDTSTGVSVMDVSATNIAVTLDTHKHTTFKISDREASRSFQNLVDEFLDPAMLALANAVDVSLLSLYTDVSTVVSYTSAGAWKTLVSTARQELNSNMAPEQMRYLVLSDDDEADLFNLDLITKANESGARDGFLNGFVGRFKGFDLFRGTNVRRVGSPAVRKNLAFHRNAFALVMRPLSTATGQTPGAIQRTASDPDAGLTLRLTISYNTTLLSTQVTVDLLYGVKTLDEQLACVINGQG